MHFLRRRSDIKCASYATLSVKAAAKAETKTEAKPAPAAKPAKKVEKNDDDLDLFGDDEPEAPAAKDAVTGPYEDIDESLTEEEKAAARARRERMETARRLKEEKDAKEGKKKKEKEAEKSLVVLEVKPWEADTDLEGLWKKIIEYQQEGLTWGQTFKLEPVAYGIKKLVMTATIVDSLVVLDDITENIESFEDYVQSVTIASMNKI